MNRLPEHFFCALREDLKNVDYSKWERRYQRNGLKTKPKPVLWSSVHSDRKMFRSSHGPTTETNESPNEIKQESGRCQGNTTKDSSAASCRFSRKIKTDEGKQDSACINDNAETLKLLIKLQRRSVKELEKYCEVLLETNHQVARDIEGVDRGSVASAREFLIQHGKLGSSMAALNRWNNWQIQQAAAELQDAVKEAEDCLSGLQMQLKTVNASLVDAQAERHTLKTYKDEEHPVKVLQIAEVKRDLDKLKEAQQGECEDVKVLCQTERARLERQLHQKQQDVLSAIAKKNVSDIPPVVKLMALHNCTMKKEIEMYKKEIMQLEDNNRKLIKNIQELQLSRPNINREVFQDVFPKSDKCTPGMDVCLRVPRQQWLPI